MKNAIYVMLLAAAMLPGQTDAQDSTLFPRGAVGANTNNYTGTIWLSELNHPDSNFTFSLAQAVYAKGSKLDWHVHPGGQYLLITGGTGYYQEKGKSIQVVHKGDVIKCLPGVEHWHGAAPDHTFSYVGVTPTGKGKTIWLKRVTDEEYNNANK